MGGALSGVADFIDDLAGSEIQGKCDEPGSHYWWDRVHPTTVVHKAIGEDLKNFLEQRGYVGNSTGTAGQFAGWL